MALIQCHFDYSCSSWYEGVCKSLRNRLQVMQNKTVRFLKSWDPELELITQYFQMLKFLILKTESNNLDLITYTTIFMTRILNIRDKISVKREIYIITQ